MTTPRRFLLLIVCSSMLPGCSNNSRVELEKVRKEMELVRQETEKVRLETEKMRQQVELKREELKSGSPPRRESYLEELERLASLRDKSAITVEEFEARKLAILASATPGVAPVRTPNTSSSGSGDVNELAGQLRTLKALYNSSTITASERDAKKAQLLKMPIRVIDMKQELEMLQTLYNETVISAEERDQLKQRVLELDK